MITVKQTISVLKAVTLLESGDLIFKLGAISDSPVDVYVVRKNDTDFDALGYSRIWGYKYHNIRMLLQQGKYEVMRVKPSVEYSALCGREILTKRVRVDVNRLAENTVPYVPKPGLPGAMMYLLMETSLKLGVASSSKDSDKTAPIGLAGAIAAAFRSLNTFNKDEPENKFQLDLVPSSADVDTTVAKLASSAMLDRLFMVGD